MTQRKLYHGYDFLGFLLVCTVFLNKEKEMQSFVVDGKSEKLDLKTEEIDWNTGKADNLIFGLAIAVVPL